MSADLYDILRVVFFLVLPPFAAYFAGLRLGRILGASRERLFWSNRIRAAAWKRDESGKLDPGRGMVQLFDDLADRFESDMRKKKPEAKKPPKDLLQ